MVDIEKYRREFRLRFDFKRQIGTLSWLIFVAYGTADLLMSRTRPTFTWLQAVLGIAGVASMLVKAVGKIQLWPDRIQIKDQGDWSTLLHSHIKGWCRIEERIAIKDADSNMHWIDLSRLDGEDARALERCLEESGLIKLPPDGKPVKSLQWIRRGLLLDFAMLLALLVLIILWRF